MRRIALVLLTILVAACGGGESRKEDHLQKGQAFLAERNYAKARVEFRNALQIDPSDVQARALAGLAAERLGNFEEAANLYRATLDLDPGQQMARTNLARMLLAGGAPDQALEMLRPGLERDPKSAQLLSVRASALASTAAESVDLAAARKDAEAALDLAPDDPEVVIVAASLRWRVGERSQALALLDQSIGRLPDAHDLRDMRVQLALLDGDVAAAEQGLLELIRRRPEALDQRNRLAEVYLIQGKVDPGLESLREIVARDPRNLGAKTAVIEALATHRSWAEAERQLLSYLQDEPGNLDLRLEAARLYESQGRSAEARAIYAEILKDNGDRPQAARARSRLALMEIQAGNESAAYALVNEVLAANPADGEALLIRSQLALERGDTQTTIGDLRTALRDRPDSVAIATALSRAHLQAGETALAEQTLRDLVRSRPSNVEAQLALAQFLVDGGRGAQATPILEQLVAAQPGNAKAVEALYRQQMFTKDYVGAQRTSTLLEALPGQRMNGRLFGGLAVEGQGRYDDARKVYEAEANSEPTSVDPVVALARLEANRGKPEAALGEIDRALARGGFAAAGTALLQSLRGDLLLAVPGRAEDAAQAFAESLRLNPAQVGAWRGQAEALDRAGKPGQALAALEMGVTATGQSPVLLFELATRHELAGRRVAAEQAYELTLKTDPGNLIARNNLVMLLISEPTTAQRIARAGQLAEPLSRAGDPRLLDTWGWTLHRAGKSADAVPVLQRAVGLAPQLPKLRFHFGMAQLASGQSIEGRVTLEEALRLGLDEPWASQARSVLATPSVVR